MALSHDWSYTLLWLIWICTLLFSDSFGKRTQTYYMEGLDCGDSKHIGGATVYSNFRVDVNSVYGNNIECQMTFKAENKDWRLMLRIIELDIPDRTSSGLCNDALYVYDESSIYARAMKEANGNTGLCGNILPPTLYSTGQYLTLHFRTNSNGPSGRGFKFIITAFSEDYLKHETCGSQFQCDNKWCIDLDLVCDNIDHCGDYSDETGDGRAKCRQQENGVLNRFLSLGVTASIAITVGSIVIVVACIVAFICCCRKTVCKKSPDTGVTTTTTAVVANGTQPPNNVMPGPRPGGPFSNHGYTHQGYYPMQPVYPASHGSVYSAYAKEQYGVPQGSSYSSHPSHQSHQRSYTPTSSKSGKSNRSNNSTSVTYSQGTEKVSLPVNL